MKKINLLALALSFAALAVLLGVTSMAAAPPSVRFTWLGMNPLNSVRGVYMMFHKFLDTAPWLTWILSVALILVIWWRMYVVVCRFFKK